MSIDCKCKLVKAGFPPSYDQTDCPTHGPDAPRFFIDHGMIHDRVTSKHVTTGEDYPDGHPHGDPGISQCLALLNTLADEAADSLALLARGVELFGEDHVPTFEEAWKRKEADGYQYGADALELVRFGWELRTKYAGLKEASPNGPAAK